MSIMMRAVVAGGNLKVYGLAFGRDSLGTGAMVVLIANEGGSGDVEKLLLRNLKLGVAMPDSIPD